MRDKLMLAGSFCLGAAIWMSPVPDGVVEDAWRLFAIFISTILAVISGGAGILLASILALVIAVLSGTLEPTTTYSGFSQGFILLIVVAFLVGRGVVNSGLGSRIGYLLISGNDHLVIAGYSFCIFGIGPAILRLECTSLKNRKADGWTGCSKDRSRIDEIAKADCL